MKPVRSRCALHVLRHWQLWHLTMVLGAWTWPVLGWEISSFTSQGA